ncbi:peptide ABC transporter substrate-binding protein [Devosia geojensis]|uniref:Peptide ABC transporter substrate-binding protein n=1 Tax=Devosia geojensis TaxID=443610 RepID=A0A0F5FUK5_9HYPH|nr:ABC transporter substrate-binding protein [Devosia geojensis]KKB12255.1 peptide ABC transporter substrate-binding protein [Devosia geojensis]
MQNIDRLKSLAAVAALFLGATALPALAQDNAGLCPAGYAEAPQLKAMVDAGTLPPVAERLPLEPLVIQPAEETGVYGGQFVDSWGGGNIAEIRHFGYEPLVRWSIDGAEVVPGIAKGWEISEDAQTYTFFLREGMKWSDGHPFTADDIVFWWERVENNPKVMTGGPRNEYKVDGEAPTVTKVDDYTVAFSWSKPNGLFLQQMAGPYGQRVVQFPRHYMEQFDIDLNPEGVAEMMTAAGATDYAAWWKGNIGSYNDPAQFNDPKRPSVHAWIGTDTILGKERVTFVRNPYYFAVDPDCQQLPYIDERVWASAPDPEVTLLQSIQGQLSMSPRNVSIPQNRAVFFDNQEAGDYRLVPATSCDYNTAVLAFSMNHPDPVKAQVFSNKDFRIGVSQAINRQEIIDTVYLGQGEPFQPAPLPNSPFYNEAMAKQYTEFDLAAAAEHLDKILPMGPDGVRLGPDGKPFKFSVEINADFKPDTVDAFQLIERTWEQVGLDVTINFHSDELFGNARAKPDSDASVWVGENGCGQLPLLNLSRFMNDYGGWSLGNWSGWAAWDIKRLNPDAELPEGWEPIEPSANVQRLYELRSLIPQTIGEEQTALMKEFTDLQAEEFLVIGIATPAGFYRAVKNDVRNVPDELIEGWLYPGPAPANFASFFVRSE